jgi:hypothetical protein
VIALVLTGAGVGAGLALKPPPAPEGEGAEPSDGGHSDGGHSGAASADDGHGDASDGAEAPEFVKLSNQFVVPVVEGGRVTAMVALAISLEVGAGQTDATYAREPKLRDAFLRVLFDHANAGGFRGTFTDGANMVVLRKALFEAGVSVMGKDLHDVLITDFARQDT